jgi:hypothetical protein
LGRTGGASRGHRILSRSRLTTVSPTSEALFNGPYDGGSQLLDLLLQDSEIRVVALSVSRRTPRSEAETPYREHSWGALTAVLANPFRRTSFSSSSNDGLASEGLEAWVPQARQILLDNSIVPVAREVAASLRIFRISAPISAAVAVLISRTRSSGMFGVVQITFRFLFLAQML